MQGTKGKVDSPFTCDVIACLVWLGLALGGTNSPDLHGTDNYLQTKNTIVKIITHDRQLCTTQTNSAVFSSAAMAAGEFWILFSGIIKTSRGFLITL
ncbi:hypothetical protein NC651_016225 [Populus alba x Populus x berolinensis]|nr:hypothetical protein NC651_016225 [Populus alba x Populus x berolinensis]